MLLILFALPFITIGSGYIVPNVGFFGISFAKSGIGLVIINLFSAVLGGGFVGLLLAYRRREASWALLGPLAGVVMCGTLFDIGNAWAVRADRGAGSAGGAGIGRPAAQGPYRRPEGGSPGARARASSARCSPGSSSGARPPAATSA